MERYSVEPRKRKYVKGYVFLPLVRNICHKYETKNIGYYY